MERTINGKTLQEVITALTREFPEYLDNGERAVLWREQKTPYLRNETYKERLDEVVGVLNYDFVPSDNQDGVPTVVLLENQYALVVCRYLRIRYDDGTVCKTVSGTGKRDLVRFKADREDGYAGKLQPFANDFAAAITSAFVDCCKQLGIGVSDISKAEKAGCTANQKKKGTVSEKIRFLDVKQKSSKCTKITGITSGGESIIVCIWQDSPVHRDLADKQVTLDQFIACGKKKELTLEGSRNEYNGEQQFNVFHCHAVT